RTVIQEELLGNAVAMCLQPTAGRYGAVERIDTANSKAGGYGEARVIEPQRCNRSSRYIKPTRRIPVKEPTILCRSVYAKRIFQLVLPSSNVVQPESPVDTFLELPAE